MVYGALRAEIGKILRELCTGIDTFGVGDTMSTVGGNKQAVQKYIQNQETEDMITDQISMVEYYDPFKQWLENNKKNLIERNKEHGLLVCGRRVLYGA